ncbi:hypothetical protein [Azospirillum sp.]|uniref:hypothetical protein n=1 Tax=Azospirillum sp. TaxID=34012 RepID=UPI002631CD31|nr:hypothetical protein [Azospirillum sp.]
MSKIIERQRLIRAYRDETGETEIDMRKVAEFAVKKGWPLPKPTDPLDALAKLFSDAARLETRRDPKTGNPYRANHAVPNRSASGQLSFAWVDIDDPKTTPTNMRASLVMRREQMVDDGLQLTFDMERWNNIRPVEEHIDLPMDLTFDIDLRRAAREDDEDDAA